MVLGDPGSGKRTLLRYIALSFAQGPEALEARLGLKEEGLPILVSIGGYAAALREEPELPLAEFLPRPLTALGLPDLALLFARELARGRCMVLLDGLDEVLSGAERNTVVRRVEAFVREHPDNRFVVTSRVAGYQAAPLNGGFAHYTIQPFREPEIRHFAHRWSRAFEGLGAAEEGQGDPAAEARARAREKSLVQAVTGHPGIQRLAANPLLLTILALIHEQGTRLPHRRVELYRLCIEALAETWNLACSLSGRPIDLWLGNRRLEERFVVRVLAPVAYWMHLHRPGELIARPELERQIAEHLVWWEGVSPEEAPALAGDFVDLMRGQVGLLVERGLQQFGFAHLSFQEYLAARHIAGRRDPFGAVAPHLHDPRWREVILLTAGILSGEHAADFVRAVLSAGSAYEEILHRDLLLAARCLADDVAVDYPLRREILDRLFDLWHNTDFAKLRQDIEHILAAMGGTASATEVVRRLIGALEDPDPGVRARAARLLGRMEERGPEAVSALLGALGNEEAPVRVAAALALGRLGAATPEVVDGLLRVLGDEEADVRAQAARAVGELGVWNAGVEQALLPLLSDKATGKWMELTEVGWPVLWEARISDAAFEALQRLVEIGGGRTGKRQENAGRTEG